MRLAPRLKRYLDAMILNSNYDVGKKNCVEDLRSTVSVLQKVARGSCFVARQRSKSKTKKSQSRRNSRVRLVTMAGKFQVHS